MRRQALLACWILLYTDKTTAGNIKQQWGRIRLETGTIRRLQLIEAHVKSMRD